MTMDHVAVSPISSPMKSHEGSVARAHAVARAAAASSQRVQHSTGNIRVATKIATEANGYDSDLEESIGNGGKGGGDGSGGGGSGGGSGNAWETPRDGVSLRGKGGGIRRSRNNSKAPSETSESNQMTSLFGNDLSGSPLSGSGPSNGVNGVMSLPQQQEEEDRACETVRQQMKQVTSMVVYRARKNDSKKGGKKDKDGDDDDSSSSSSKSKKTFELPKSPRRRSIIIDNDDEDDFTRLIGAMGAESALGLKTKRRGGRGDASGSGMKPRKPKGKKSSGGRRGSVMRKNRKTKTTKKHKSSSPSISTSSEF